MIEKGVAMPHQLSWSHVLMILPLKDVNEINYYISSCINNNYKELIPLKEIDEIRFYYFLCIKNQELEIS